MGRGGPDPLGPQDPDAIPCTHPKRYQMMRQSIGVVSQIGIAIAPQPRYVGGINHGDAIWITRGPIIAHLLRHVELVWDIPSKPRIGFII